MTPAGATSRSGRARGANPMPTGKRADGQTSTSFALPRELLEAARAKAARQGRSFSAVLRDLLQRWVDEHPGDE